MTKAELIDRLKAQRDQISVLISELEAADANLLLSTSINDLDPGQFTKLCAAALQEGMKPVVISTVEAASKVIASAQFEDETERLSGVRRSRAIVGCLTDDEEDKGN